MLNSASALRASHKVQSSLIGSRQCTFHRAIDEPCELPLSPRIYKQFSCKFEMHFCLSCLSVGERQPVQVHAGMVPASAC